uniref:Uncharacterized protein n=1 Tax=Panagrolaimus sp. PS1159 TaxID=55785 RepID=A0AC35F4G2_9BILA
MMEMNRRSNDNAKHKKQISGKHPLRSPLQPDASSSNEAQVITPSRHRLNSNELQKPERQKIFKGLKFCC